LDDRFSSKCNAFGDQRFGCALVENFSSLKIKKNAAAPGAWTHKPSWNFWPFLSWRPHTEWVSIPFQHKNFQPWLQACKELDKYVFIMFFLPTYCHTSKDRDLSKF
jgi:hypothetical protein